MDSDDDFDYNEVDEDHYDENDDDENEEEDQNNEDYEGEVATEMENISTSNEKEYKILTSDDINKTQKEEMDKVSNLMDLPAATARIILTFYKWDVEVLLSQYLDRGIEYVYKQVGMTQDQKVEKNEKNSPKKESTGKGGKKFECPSCFDNFDMKDTTALECDHRFCNDCWEAYIRMKIKDGETSKIICMGQKCSIPFPEPLLLSFVNDDPVVIERYNRFLIDSYITESNRRKWCPSVPHCGRAVEISYGSNVEVQCICGVKFCFRCLASPSHSPCTCDMMKKWLKKLQDDSETANYLGSKTKECPKCGKTIEKDGGCNLVTCKCGQHFCWLCGQATGAQHTWTEISGHTCGKYEDQAEKEDTARRLLERFLHFFTRYKAQADSAKAELKLHTEIPKKIVALRADTKHSYANSELQWLEKAVVQLQEARRVLGNSYAFAFYAFGEQDYFSPNQTSNPKKINIQGIIEEAGGKVPLQQDIVVKPLPKGKAAVARAAKEEKKIRKEIEKEKKKEKEVQSQVPPSEFTNNGIISQKASLASLKNIFNDHQEQLEFTTERLSALLETKLERIDESHLKDVMNYTVLADRRCRGLFDVIQNEILQDGSQIPNYKPLIPSAEMSGYLVTLTSLPTESYTTKNSTTITTTTTSSSSNNSKKDPKVKEVVIDLTQEKSPAKPENKKPQPQEVEKKKEKTNEKVIEKVIEKEKEKDKEQKELKRKIWDPTSKEYDEDAALQEALKLSQSPSFPPPPKKPIFEGEEPKGEGDEDYKKALENSLIDEDPDLNMALQISLHDK